MTSLTGGFEVPATDSIDLTDVADASMRASVWIEGVMRAVDTPADLYDRAALAVAEAVANAVEHGRPPIRAHVSARGGTWTVIVEEGGEGPATETLASASLPTELTATHGRGLYLIATLSDDVQIAPGRLRLVFRARSS